MVQVLSVTFSLFRIFKKKNTTYTAPPPFVQKYSKLIKQEYSFQIFNINISIEDLQIESSFLLHVSDADGQITVIYNFCLCGMVGVSSVTVARQLWFSTSVRGYRPFVPIPVQLRSTQRSWNTDGNIPRGIPLRYGALLTTIPHLPNTLMNSAYHENYEDHCTIDLFYNIIRNLCNNYFKCYCSTIYEYQQILVPFKQTFNDA